MKFNIVTLFPEYFDPKFLRGVVGQAIDAGNIELEIIQLREFAIDKHKSVDDSPFGGGDGMVMTPIPFENLFRSKPTSGSWGKRVFLSPQGNVWKDEFARDWARSSDEITLVCGRYAGVDQRVINTFFDEEVSLGDYVLSGGELGALVLIDSISRHCKGVLGNELSSEIESFSQGLLECPQFTRPRDWGEGVPEVLLSGDHKKILEFQFYISIVNTLYKRVDLIEKLLSGADGLITIPIIKTAIDYFSKLKPEDKRALGLESFLTDFNIERLTK